MLWGMIVPTVTQKSHFLPTLLLKPGANTFILLKNHSFLMTALMPQFQPNFVTSLTAFSKFGSEVAFKEILWGLFSSQVQCCRMKTEKVTNKIVQNLGIFTIVLT